MRWMRRITIVIGGLIGLLLLTAAYSYFSGEAHIASFEPTHEFTAPIPTDAASLARGQHLLQSYGCADCHGADLAGNHMDPDLPWFLVRLVAPNIGKLAKTESPVQLEAAIRQGIRHDGRAMIVMPSGMYSNLSDQDTAAIIAALKAVPVAEKELPRPYLGPAVYLGMLTGEFDGVTAPEQVRTQPGLKLGAESDLQLRQGEYLAMTSCTECHGQDLHGDRPWEPGKAPDLGGARSYPAADFANLMKTGVPPGGRKLDPLMQYAARGRFVHFTDDEVGALYAYLSSLDPKSE